MVSYAPDIEQLLSEVENIKREKMALSNQLQNAYALWRSSKVAYASLERTLEKIKSKKEPRAAV